MFQSIDGKITELSQLTGFGKQDLIMVICLLLCYPLSFFFIFVKTTFRSPAIRHIFSIVPAALASIWLFGWDTLHSFISSTIGYFLIFFLKGSPYSPKFVFAFAMLYVSASHLYSIWHSYMNWELDFTRPQMIITIKMITLAYDIYDNIHRRPEELTNYEKEKKVAKMPTLLEYYGYIYFFPSYLVGPAINFNDYKAYIESAFDKEMPSTVFPTIRRFSLALFCLAFIIPMGGWFPHTFLCTAEYYETVPLIPAILYLWASVLTTRFTFYFAWLLGEGTLVACGLAYNGKRDGVSRWDKATNIDVWGFELGQSPREIVAAWNQGVQKWLYHYVYVRTFSETKITDKLTGEVKLIRRRQWYSIVYTNLMSAFWHGFYPGYYLGFASLALVSEVATIARDSLRHRFVSTDPKTGKEVAKPLKPVYNFFGWLGTQLFCGYAMVPFVVLHFNCSLNLWMKLWFMAHAVMVVVFLMNWIGALKGLKERKESTKVA